MLFLESPLALIIVLIKLCMSAPRAISNDSSNSGQIELYLSFGASRWEVGRQLLLKPAVRLAMLPTITQMRFIALGLN
jgi:ABC-type iron transport system FetAB permease component